MTDFERDDMELAAMMGDKFVDETVPLSEMPRTTEETTDVPKPKKTAGKPMDAQWMPTKQRNWMDNLKECAKSSLIYGGLNMLIWYWEMSGLMDESIARPSSLVCAVLFGVGIGKFLLCQRCKRGKCRCS